MATGSRFEFLISLRMLMLRSECHRMYRNRRFLASFIISRPDQCTVGMRCNSDPAKRDSFFGFLEADRRE